MARVLYGALVVEMKGKIGGTVFQSNRFGFTARQKPISPKVSSSLQGSIHNVFADTAQHWRTLTDGQRTAWDVVAPNWPHNDKFGNPVQLTGYNLFMKLSLNLQNIVQPINDVASNPALVFNPVAPTLAIAVGAGQMDVSFFPSPIDQASTLVISATPQHSAGAKLVKSKLRLVERFVVTTASPVSIASEYTKKFGAFPLEGSKVSISLTAYATSNGTASPPVTVSAIVQP